MVSRILLICDRRAALFVERASSLACLSSSMSESSPFKLLHSVLNILLNFGVVRFGQFSAFPGQMLFNFGFLVVDGAELREVVSQVVPRSHHGIPNSGQFSSGLCDPRGVHLRIINDLQCGLDVF